MKSDAVTSRSFDTSGNLISGSETTRAVSYAYDNIGRLKSESGSSGNKTYGYDNWDNLTSVNTANSLIEEFSYNNSNRLMVKSNQTPAGSMINTTNYTYDNAGNRVEAETFDSSYISMRDITYTYDAMNRMTSYQSVTPSGTALTSYSYDAMNRRATKTSGSSRTDYAYDSNGSVCYERKSSLDIHPADIQYLCGLWTEGVTTADVSSATRGNFAFYVHNVQGDVVAKSTATDHVNAIIAARTASSPLVPFYNPAVTTTTYDAYGNVTGGTGDSIGYRNYYRDSESGMYYLNARYYDSSARSFTQQDPAKDGSNWYGYCSGNPVKYIDPTGLAREDFAQVPSQAYFAKRWYDENGHLQSELYYDAAFTMPCEDIDLDAINNEEREATPEEKKLLVKTAIANGNRAITSSAETRDVTSEINNALLIYALQASIERFSVNSLQGVERVAGELTIYTQFYFMVRKYAIWDIKLQAKWEKTIGTKFPGEGVQVKYDGFLMTPEDLGNFTYGYLGAAFGIPYFALLGGSYYAADFPTGGDDYENELKDWYYITLGYDYYILGLIL